MKAAVLHRPNELSTEEIETPSPGPGEVLVKVGANTICGTDLRIARGEKTSYVELPVVLGHETAGHVGEVGQGVEGFETGAPVAMAPGIPCRHCWECRHDLENMCRNLRLWATRRRRHGRLHARARRRRAGRLPGRSPRGRPVRSAWRSPSRWPAS